MVDRLGGVRLKPKYNVNNSEELFIIYRKRKMIEHFFV